MKIESLPISGSYAFSPVQDDAGHTIVAYFSKAYEIGGIKLSSDSRTATVENLLSVTSSVLTGMVFDENGTLFRSRPSPWRRVPPLLPSRSIRRFQKATPSS